MPPHRTRIKICCIRTPEEAAMAVAAGADAIGLVGPMPSGPGIVTLESAAEIARGVNTPVSRFLLSSETTAEALINAVQETHVDTLQIVRHLDPGILEAVSARLPHVRLVQMIHVENESALELIPVYADHVSAFLLDSGAPARAELGGTGRTHDWNVSAHFVKASPRPVFLAGGLDHTNVAEALHRVQPFGLDLCSSVRTNDHLDRSKLTQFITAVRDAERTLS